MLGVQSTYLVSQVFLALGNWFLLASIARNFSLEATGAYNLALAIQTPVFLLFSLQLRNHYLSAKDGVESLFVNYLCLRICALFPAIILCIFGGWVFDSLGPFFWGILLLKASELIFELPFMAEHKRDRLLSASLIHILRSLIVYGFLGICLWSGQKVFASFLFASLSSLALSFWYLRYIFNSKFFGDTFQTKSSWNISPKTLKALVDDGLHLGASAAVLSFNISLARFFIGHFLGKSELAIYSVSFAFYGVWQLIFNSYLNSALPKFKNARNFDLIKAPLALFAIFSLFFMFFGDAIYSGLFGAEYRIADELSPYLLISVFISFIASFLYYSLMASGDFKSHFKFNTISFLVNLGLTYPCIQVFGLKGAYIAWSLSLMVLCCLYRRKKNIKTLEKVRREA